MSVLMSWTSRYELIKNKLWKLKNQIPVATCQKIHNAEPNQLSDSKTQVFLQVFSVCIMNFNLIIG